MNSNESLVMASKYYKLGYDLKLERNEIAFSLPNDKNVSCCDFDSINSRGYKSFMHKHSKGGCQYRILSHRMIYYLYYGFIPNVIDHVDKNKINNHPSNLRSVTCSQNGMNRSADWSSKSKFLGVTWDESRSKWKVRIMVDGKRATIGRYECEIEAASMRNLAAMELHGEFASFNDVSQS